MFIKTTEQNPPNMLSIFNRDKNITGCVHCTQCMRWYHQIFLYHK